MRPPLFSGGNLERMAHVMRCSPASMRPPLFSGGNFDAALLPGHDPRASMRPPLFSGGNGPVSTSHPKAGSLQ